MLKAYEAATYFEGGGDGYSAYGSQQKSLTATFSQLLRQLASRGITGGDLLDVGCGYGYMLEAAVSYFRCRVGTDFSPAAVQEASLRADAVYTGGLSSLPEDAAFDCVTALHVIEHVYDPTAFANEAMERVRPGGWFVVAAPDMASYWRRVLGRRWPSFKFPEHVVYYDRKSLTSVVGATGKVARAVAIPYPHAFPLTEVCSKVGITAPERLNHVNIWLPGTTVAVAFQRVEA